MKKIREKISAIEWQTVTDAMHANGFALIRKLLTDVDCEEIVRNYNKSSAFRKTGRMEQHGFGLGEYKYFTYPLPGLIQTLRQEIYPKLSPIANSWMEVLKLETKFPDRFDELQILCNNNDQTKPAVLILKYGKGGHNTLHQDLRGKIFFPIQAVLFLNQPGADYTGGEFVLVQQTPETQSKAIVLKPRKGDMLLFTTGFRPLKGNEGYYNVNVKHGVSELHCGERYTLGIIFHDELS